MSKPATILRFRSLESLARKLRRDLRGVHGRKKTSKRKGTPKINGNDFVLLFAHNGVGKTRLSMEFKDVAKKRSRPDTLYYNAFTEDLFDWDNDFAGDKERKIHFKSHSKFFEDLAGSGVEDLIRPHLNRYADFNFTIDYDAAEIRFFRDVVERGKSVRREDIKISRGEENVFIWCFFLAILQLALEAEKGDRYDWVKFVYIDDPVSSLDEHNTICLASDLAELLRGATNRVKVIVSTHHGLFFNVMFNELKGKRMIDGDSEDIRKKSYVLSPIPATQSYALSDTGESPFLQHVAALGELQSAAKSGKIFQHHFNTLRSILEKTAIFFGYQHLSTCFEGSIKKSLFVRFLNVRSHAKYSVFEPKLLNLTEAKKFREILDEFTKRYSFKSPSLRVPRTKGVALAPVT
jgi:wobble nucleotide-excising tRNase